MNNCAGPSTPTPTPTPTYATPTSAYAHSYSYIHAYAYSLGVTNTNGYFYAHAYSFGVAQCNIYSYTDTDTGAMKVIVAGSTGANGIYTTLKAAFDAINANTNQTGNNITVTIVGDTDEGTLTASLNNPSGGNWNSLIISPTGVRTVKWARPLREVRWSISMAPEN